MHRIKPIYPVSEYLTLNMLYNFGFFKTYCGEILYRFVVYKYNNRKPLVFCEFVYDEEEKQIHIKTKDINNFFVSYNKEEYGKSNVTKKINSKIYEELVKLKKKGIVK